MISPKTLIRAQMRLTALSTFLVICGVSVLYCMDLGIFRWADNFFYDHHFKRRGPGSTSGQVVLVLMDEKSAVELGRRKGSWSSRHLARAMDNLCRSGAKVVGVDMTLSAPDTDPGADRLLAGSIDTCNNVVLARVLSTLDGFEVTPLPMFQEGMIGDGFIDLPLDGDDILRRVRFLNARPLPDGSLEIFPSFSLELARVFLDLDFAFDFSRKHYFLLGGKDNHIRLPHPELLINYRGGYSVFPQLSYADVVKGRFSPETVKGKIVIIGSSLTVQKDFFSTSFSRFYDPTKAYRDRFGTVVENVQKDLGVACHAHAVDTILTRTYIKNMPAYGVIALIVILGLAGLIFYMPRVNVLWVALFLCGSVVGIEEAGYVLFAVKLWHVDIAPAVCVVITQFMAGIVLQKTFDKRKTALVTSLFGKYVSPDIVDDLIREDIDTLLEGHHQEVTVLFSDLRNFTSLSEQLGARDTSSLLNIYFDGMIPIVREHRGTLDKLIGDAVMAYFGAPVPFDDHAVRAAETALKMVDELDRIRQEHIKGAHRLALGIGLNTGTVTIGNLGSHEFMNYTIIGDAVNLASRLEGLNKVYGTRIIVSESAASRLDKRFVVRELDRVKVKGREQPVTIFELLGLRDRVDDHIIDMAGCYESGLAAYRTRDWDTARTQFEKVLGLVPRDHPAKMVIDRTNRFKDNPPPPDWDGVTAVD